ncbi:MAG TPA: ROK family protein [Hanamia sp.]|nr:ROK family protein [Hanamia sp.]
MEDRDEKILAIDIGGSHVKATVLNSRGNFLEEYKSEKTPDPASPDKVMSLIKKLVQHFAPYDKIAAGFPGFVKEGIVKTAPKLGNDLWQNYPLAQSLEQILGKPALAINDADLQGLALSSGKGVEMMITLGTGFGSAILRDGILLPHLEMSQHPITKKKNYNDYVGEEALLKVGKKKWNKRMKKVIGILKTVFNYDHLYISGGNAELICFPLDKNVSITNNKDGIKGGAILWELKKKN